MFLKHQSIILEWFLNDHVALKTENSVFAITEINYILKMYNKIEQLF